MAGSAAEPSAAEAPAPAGPAGQAPDNAPVEEPAAKDVAAAFEDRIGREPAEPADDLPADDLPADDTDGDPEGEFRANFDDAFAREPDTAARPLRRDGSRNLPALPRDSNPWIARIAWIALVVVVLGVVGGALAFQDSISKSWPPAQKLYDLIGMSAEPIEKRLGVRSVQYTYPDKDTLRIDGELVNLSKVPHNVPNLRILFLDATGKVVKRWRFPPPERRMLPDEIVKFSTEVKNPPADAKRIDVGIDEN